MGQRDFSNPSLKTQTEGVFMQLGSRGRAAPGTWGRSLCVFSHRWHFFISDSWASAAGHRYLGEIPSYIKANSSFLLQTQKLCPPDCKQTVHQQHKMTWRQHGLRGGRIRILRAVSSLWVSEVIFQAKSRNQTMSTALVRRSLCCG